MLNQLIRPSLIFFGIGMPLWFLFRYIVAQKNKNKQEELYSKHELLLFIFFIYIGVVLLLTIVPLPIAREKYPGSTRINIIPIYSTARHFMATLTNYWTFIGSGSMENVFGNFVLFAPLGFLLPLLSDKFNNWKRILQIAFMLSFSIELIQLASRVFALYRSVDIDDVLLNTAGALSGFYFHEIIKPQHK